MHFSVVNAGEVKSVHGLAVFEHDIVRDVDYVVYRSHSGISDTLAHPGGRRGDLYVFYHSGSVSRAELGVLNDDLGHIVDIAAGFGFNNRGVKLKLLTESNCRFSCKPYDAETVRTVRGDLKFHNMVIHAYQLADIVSGGTVFFNYPYPVFDRIGVVVQSKAELL